MEKKKFKKIKLNPVQILAIGFGAVILTGAFLLSLPISSARGTYTNFTDCVFTATSAVCVTGLVTLDTGTHWSYFGKTIIITLIQIGGLGFMSFATLLSLILGKKITLRERLIMQESMNTFNIQGLVKLAKYVLMFTFSVELIGALLLSTQFIPQFGLGKGIYYSIWHSISAFCNAGFDLMGGFSSLTAYSENIIVILTIGALIVVGGLGFVVWSEIYNYKGLKKMSTHSKLVILMTFILIFGGALLMFLFEYDNPATLQPLTFKGKLFNSLFASITPRTAGFNSISTSGMTTAGIFLTIILMFIGGSPGSTAGGIKTSTFGILVMTIISVIKGREDTEVFKKRIPKDIVYKSLAIIMMGLLLVISVTMILSITEAGAPFDYLLYEVTSAFGTVGLTLGLTTELTTIGKVLLIITMYLGRVGVLTVVLALTRNKSNSGIRYPEDRIIVG
ncbi:TrkH family potassium uptake protein [Clostridium polynesiense]|uniref:TrkH family potassium uptake protein n=1 Tax=Clostridium polynesiense TaxID=1325933 RepID=UPI00058B2007|nr:TrkH family potassium uptake protein [Clostridium polynesiense]